MFVFRLMLAVVLAGLAAPAFAQDCGASFYWTGPGGSIAVWPADDLVRIELAPATERTEDDVPSGALLVLQAPAAGLSNGFSDAGLSLSPPAVVAGPGESAVRVRYGRQRTGLNHPPRVEIFPGSGAAHRYQAWADFPRGTTAGWFMTRHFRRTGALTAVLATRTSGGGWREQTEARFDWDGVESLAARARDWLVRCPVA